MKPSHQSPLSQGADALDVAPPTPGSIQAAKDAQAAERRRITETTGVVFIGDRIVSQADQYDRLAQLIADAILRATHRLN